MRKRIAALVVASALLAGFTGVSTAKAGNGTVFIPTGSCIVGGTIGYQAGVAPYLRGAAAVACSVPVQFSVTLCLIRDQGNGIDLHTINCASSVSGFSLTWQGSIRHNCGYTTVHYRWWLSVLVHVTDRFGFTGTGTDISNGLIPVGPSCH